MSPNQHNYIMPPNSRGSPSPVIWKKLQADSSESFKQNRNKNEKKKPTYQHGKTE